MLRKQCGRIYCCCVTPALNTIAVSLCALNRDTAGTARFVKNAAVWLINYDATHVPRSQRQFTIDKRPFSALPWSSIEAMKGVVIKHTMPDSIQKLLDMIQNNKPLEETCKTGYFIKVAPQPFSDEGGTRLPYHAVRVR